MSVIENFSELPEQELQKFASDLVAKINAEHIFTSEVDFEVEYAEADEMTGGLYISIFHEEDITIERDATWSCFDEDEASDVPEDPEFECHDISDAKRAFKTLSTVIDGYVVTLTISEVVENDIVDVSVGSISNEDGGIGHYEYFGYRGYDSRPYVEVSGTLSVECSLGIALTVEPADEVSASDASTEE